MTPGKNSDSKVGCLGLLSRAFDYRFAELHQTENEQTALEGLGKNISGYLVWRRTLLFPTTGLMCFSWLLQVAMLYYTYSPGSKSFIEDFVGPTAWNNIFCPTKPCNGADGLVKIYYVLLLTDILLLLVALASCVLLVLASRSWASYGDSAKPLRRAYTALFAAPFLLLLPAGKQARKYASESKQKDKQRNNKSKQTQAEEQK